jgi:hypothetical protein
MIFCGSNLLPHNNQQWAAADYPLSSDLLGKNHPKQSEILHNIRSIAQNKRNMQYILS